MAEAQPRKDGPSHEAVPAEVNEADWLESRREADGSLVRPSTPPTLGERLAKAGEGDLLESLDDEEPSELPSELPAEAPVADVLEQRQLPTGGEEEVEEETVAGEEGEAGWA